MYYFIFILIYDFSVLCSESTQSYKVPLKACQNSVIDHNLVTILLSVEWPDRGGDEPNLVIDITNKRKETQMFFFSFIFIQYLIFRTINILYSTKSIISRTCKFRPSSTSRKYRFNTSTTVLSPPSSFISY
jgi:hypothetical protein